MTTPQPPTTGATHRPPNAGVRHRRSGVTAGGHRAAVGRRRRRLAALATPETALGCAIGAGWAVLASIELLPVSLVAFIVLLTIAVNLVTVDSGNFTLLGITTGWLLLLIVVSTRSVLDDADPILFTIAGFSALVHNELVRVAYARRRNAVIDRSALASSATGIGLVGLLATIGIGTSEPLAEAVGRSWLWMPVGVAVVGLVALAFAVVPTIGAPTAHKDRWRPGDRIPPRRSPAPRG